mgnify:CR=1 FL=1
MAQLWNSRKGIEPIREQKIQRMKVLIIQLMFFLQIEFSQEYRKKVQQKQQYKNNLEGDIGYKYILRFDALCLEKKHAMVRRKVKL